MSSHAAGAFARPSDSYPSRADAWLDLNPVERPTLVVDLDRVEASYRALAAALTGARIHYAVKANPEPGVIRRLLACGSRFDAASRAEIELCLREGVAAIDISFGNTVKRAADIAWAHGRGIDLFAADAPEELEKIAANAPAARICIRLMVEHTQADWPLTRKFGAAPEAVLPLMRQAAGLGLRPAGISFHVGSQTRAAEMWRPVLETAARVWHAARAEGFDLDVLNLGGGFPAFYGDMVQDVGSYGAEVMATVRELFGTPACVMAEPGRALVAEAGVIAAEVLLVARKRTTDIARWIYLDIGKFSGLAETMDEAIRYQIETTVDGPTGPCILAGPSCDSADVLYEKRPVQLPLALKAGDKVRIRAAGAYTATYASVGFNGFPPLDVVCI